MIGVAASVGKQVFAFGPAGSGSVRFSGKDAASPAMSQLRAALQPERIDHIIREEAIRTHAEVVRSTPIKWTGELRRRWQIKQRGLADWVVENASRIMGYLEYGTANEGTGYIYPKRAKALFIPLTRKAAMADRSFFGVLSKGIEVRGGKRKGKAYANFLERGVDYVLAMRVRGIKPRKIAEKQRAITTARLQRRMVNYIRQHLRGGAGA